jgi:amino acid transporter
MTDVATGAGDHASPLDKGLKVGALGLLSTVVIGVASTAPGYSLAASLGLVTSASGSQAPAILWLAFVPMLFIAAGYFYLNRADPDCGTTFTWATRTLGPIPGWLGGWTIIIADLVVMPSLAQITGSYFFLLFGLNGPAGNKYWTMLIGVIFILLMTLICVIGIELNANTQFGLLAIELVILVIFSVVALYKVYQGDIAGSIEPSLSWVNPLKISSTSALSGGLLAALFIYWGWDTAVTVNEETNDARRTPGVAALVSTFVLVGIYLIVAIAAQAVRGPGFLTANSGDALSATGNLVLGSPFDKVLIIAVLSSAAASTQTTILPAARSQLSMAVHRALPKWYGQINPKYLTPTNATWTFGIAAAVFYAGLTLISDNVLAASINSVGLMIAIYYGLTGIICPIYYWRFIFKSVKNFVFVGLAPFVGGAILFWTFVKSTMDSFQKPSTAWFGIASFWVMGMILLGIGIPIMLWWWSRDPAFFKRGVDPRDQRPDPDGNGPIPPPIVEGVDASILRED